MEFRSCLACAVDFCILDLGVFSGFWIVEGPKLEALNCVGFVAFDKV